MRDEGKTGTTMICNTVDRKAASRCHPRESVDRGIEREEREWGEGCENGTG